MENNSENSSLKRSGDTICSEQINRLAAEILRREAFQESAPQETAPKELPKQASDKPNQPPPPERPDMTLTFGATKLGYSHMWLTRPATVVGSLGMGFMSGVESVRPLKAGLATAWGYASAIEDGIQLTRSTSTLETTKFGAAVGADIALGTGGLMYLAGREPRLGAALMLGGLVIRTLVDLIPDSAKRA